MSASKRLNQRLVAALDRLAWGWSDLGRWLAERGFWPAATLVLCTATGEQRQLTATRLRPARGTQAAQGLLVSRADCLWGSLALPAMPRRELPSALDEALWRVSPLPPQQMLCAWRAEPHADGSWQVQWGIGRREGLQAALAQAGLDDSAPVFLQSGDDQALPVRQLAGAPRTGQGAWRLVCVALTLALVAALFTPAAVPLALKHRAVTRAMAHVTALEQQAAPLRQQLDELHQQAGLADALKTANAARLPLASTIELIARTVPDGAWLERIDVSGTTIRITGVADNAGELLTQLARQPALADVHASAASVRDNALAKERFTIEMRWREPSAQEGKP